MRLEDEIVTPKHVPVIPLSPQKDAADAAAGGLDVKEQSTAQQSMRNEPGTARYNRYEGVMVRSILRRRMVKSVKSERKKPGCHVQFLEEEIATHKSPPKWYLDAMYGAPDGDEESEMEEKEPQRPQTRLRPGTPGRVRRDTPSMSVASRWRG